MSNNTGIDARVASLETSVKILTTDVTSLVGSINDLRNTMISSQKTQWPTIFAALGIVIAIISAIGSAYITPLSVQLNQNDRVLTQMNIVIEKNQDRIRQLEIQQFADEQVAKIQLDYFKESLTDIKVNGSNGTRERLAVVEAIVGIKGKSNEAKPNNDGSGR